MDYRDSSAPPPPHIFHHHPYLHQHQHHGVMMIPHPQTQHFSLNSSYPLHGTNDSLGPPTTSMMQSSKLPFNAVPAAHKPLDHQSSDGSPSGSAGAWLGIERAKKKRGRPRKYSPDNKVGLGLSPSPGAHVSSAMDSGVPTGSLSSETPIKRNRGRPPGSGKMQMNALGVAGVGFTPHVIIFNPGEDIVSKIIDFSKQGPRTICILSATGAVSNVNLRQTTTSAVVAYEGRFDIISLSGSFPSSESNGINSEIASMSVSLSTSDGRVLGGVVAGILKAASPVQIIVGSFITEIRKRTAPTSNNTPPSNLLDFNSTRIGASHSSGGLSDSPEENGDVNCGHGSYPNLGQPILMYPMGYSMERHPTS